jgi:hypothetical protein
MDRGRGTAISKKEEVRASGKNGVGQPFEADCQARKPDLLPFFLRDLNNMAFVRYTIQSCCRISRSDCNLTETVSFVAAKGINAFGATTVPEVH